MMLPRLILLSLLTLRFFFPSFAAASSPFPLSTTAPFFSTSPYLSSARSRRWRLFFRPSRPQPSPLAIASVEHSSRTCNSSCSESRTRHFRPLLFPQTLPSASHSGFPKPDYGNAACRCPTALGFAQTSSFILGKYGSSQAAIVVWRIVWLLLLFYLLGTTASDYFNCALEQLSEVLGLSPAVAGVTLLAFGTGAPDVFSSIAAFMSSDSSDDIGFSSVLGGALFVTTVVSGTVSLVAAKVCVRVNCACFLRDALFLLTSVGVLGVILIDGEVKLWESIMFLSIYAVYAVAVSLTEFIQSRNRKRLSSESSMADPLLQKVANATSLPQLSSPPHYPVHHHDLLPCELAKDEQHAACTSKHYFFLFYKYGIEWPLSLPRRLTIPVVEEERWCRPVAVASSAIAPIFLAAVWVLEYSDSVTSLWIAAGISAALALILGLLAFFSTENSRPPQRYLWVWLLGSFLMSIVWFYLVATEIVETLELLGNLFQIDTVILGITVLAWGNSTGDLVADLALACNGVEGVQIAISGCYAGPLFITVFGLGVSLVLACYKSKPAPVLVSKDTSLYYIMGFLAAGIAWALFMLPLKGMRLSRTFGAGLVLLYSSFLVVAICYAMGWLWQ